jgi:F-type H+-transporting ATPase subunit c
MDIEAAKMLGAGLAAIGVTGAGIGIGMLFGQFVGAGIRNPAAAKTQTGNLFVGMALSEATAIFALGIAMLILFG